MAVNQQRKNAMKRLAQDLQELQKQPVENVSAAPLDENMLEWHCNFKNDDIIYHLILFLTDKYPYESPSAEFVPAGFRYNSGATLPGKKGTKVCLNIFSDFAYIHTEWKDQKGLGWSPGYTVQTILMNVVAFLAETQSGESSWMKDTATHNRKLSQGYTCSDCGHTFKKPFPPFEAPKAVPKGKGKETKTEGPQIIDYISKEHFKAVKPKSNDELYGYGLIQSGPPHRPALTTPCEFLQLGSFKGMEKAVGKVHSVMKEEVKFFLPLYIHPLHGAEIKQCFENTVLNDIAKILPKCNPKKTPIEEMVIKTIPNLMSATVVEFSKGTQHTSDNSLNGYFALHRLFLWALETYPDLEGIVNQRLKDFIDDEANRSKKACPHIGEWLMLLSGSWKYRSLDNPIGFQAPQRRGTVGRPMFIISREQLTYMVEEGFSTAEMASLLHVSRSVVKRRLRHYGISIRSRYSSITDDDLDAKVKQLTEDNPFLGQRLVQGMLAAEGIHIQRQRVADSLIRVNEAAVAMRWCRAIHRRVYKVSGPNALWHIDGNHKLIRWEEAGEAYLSESWKRQVMWYVKDDSKLGMLDTDQKYRLEHTLERTAVSRKLLAFQVLFLDIAMPKGKSRKDLIKRYDDNLGFPTPDMVKQMKESVETIGKMKTFADWFKVLKLKPPSDKEIFDKLVSAVKFSIYTDGYNWSFWKTGGGWGEVLRRYKPYTPKDKKDDKEGKGGKGKKEEEEKPVKGKGKAPLKGEPKPKGRGRGKKAEPMEESSDSEEEVVPKGRGRGRGRGKKEPEPMEESDSEEEVPKGRERGRGRGKRTAEEAFGKVGAKAGRGGKKKK